MDVDAIEPIEYRLTYAPAYRPNGSLIEPHASRQQIAERRTALEAAPSAEAATNYFERTTQRMVTACERVQ